MDKHAAFMEGFCGRLSELETQQPTACEKLASAYDLGGEAEGSESGDAGSATYESLLDRLAEIEKEAGILGADGQPISSGGRMGAAGRAIRGAASSAGSKLKGAAGAAGSKIKGAAGATGRGFKRAGGATMSGMRSATSWAGAHRGAALGIGAGAAAAGAGGYALYKHLKNKKKDD